MTTTDRRRFLRGSASLTVGAVLGPSLLAACGSDSQSEGTGSGGDRTLNVMTFEGWVGDREIASFESAFPGVTVNLVPWVSNDDAIAKAKDRSGDIDVLLVDGQTFPQLEALEVLASLGDAVPNLVNIDESYRGNPWDPDDEFFAATDYGRTGIAYRSDLLEETPTSWADFFRLAPSVSGKVAVLDFQRSVIGSALTYLGLPPSSPRQEDVDAATDQLVELKPHLLAVSTEVGAQLAAGDAVLAMADAYDIFNAKSQNDAVEWVDPTEGQVAYLEGLVVLDGPRNDLAREFVNFRLESEQYANFINTVQSAGVMPDNDLIDEMLLTTPILNPGPDVRSRVQFHEFLGDATETWQTAWDRFKSA